MPPVLQSSSCFFISIVRSSIRPTDLLTFECVKQTALLRTGSFPITTPTPNRTRPKVWFAQLPAWEGKWSNSSQFFNVHIQKKATQTTWSTFLPQCTIEVSYKYWLWSLNDCGFLLWEHTQRGADQHELYVSPQWVIHQTFSVNSPSSGRCLRLFLCLLPYISPIHYVAKKWL